MLYSQMGAEKQQEIDTLIAYLDGLLSAPRGFNRYQTTNLRDRLDVILDRPKPEVEPVVKGYTSEELNAEFIRNESSGNATDTSLLA